MATRSEQDVEAFRREKEIQIFGRAVPKPVHNFEEANFPDCTFPPVPHRSPLTCYRHHGRDQKGRIRQPFGDSVPVLADGSLRT